MTTAIYFPSDEFSGNTTPDLDLAADFLELKAAFSENRQSLSQEIIDAMELAADEEYADVDEEITRREDIATGAVNRISIREQLLAEAYPFRIDDTGDVISFTGDPLDEGETAYVVSLILSNLRSVSPLISAANQHPTPGDVRLLRRYFQYLATAAIAGEVGGPAWSFGFPRPDGSGFLNKLNEIWVTLRDGKVGADPSAPPDAKDDQIDIFAWREQKDGLPGFLLVAAQVATGANWKEKSIRGHVSFTFSKRWFHPEPVSIMVPYHVIPFARPDEKFRDDVALLGNVLHRLRVPLRVAQAAKLADSGVRIEAFDRLGDVSRWVQAYLARSRAA